MPHKYYTISLCIVHSVTRYCHEKKQSPSVICTGVSIISLCINYVFLSELSVTYRLQNHSNNPFHTWIIKLSSPLLAFKSLQWVSARTKLCSKPLDFSYQTWITYRYVCQMKEVDFVISNMHVTDDHVARADVSFTSNVLSWSGGHEFEPWSDRTWDA